MNRLHMAMAYIRYLLTAKTRHGVHSPFVFELIEEVFKAEGQFYEYKRIEYVREKLLSSSKKVQVTDLGAGSTVDNTKERSLGNIAKNVALPTMYAQLLFRLVNRLKPKTIVELGTSLGITTLYLSAPQQESTVYTLEGCPNIAEVARKNFEAMERKNIRQRVGHFDSTLPQVLEEAPTVDFAFVDGNHQYEPTLRYFEMLLSKSSESTCIVFDDIHWSAGMEKAWKEISTSAAVTCSIDMFQLGLVFLKPGIEKQHFVLKF